MSIRSACTWIAERPLRQKIITSLSQPLTAQQLARRESIDLDRAGYLFWELGTHQLVECLNRTAHKSRLYWLTSLGQRCQSRLRRRARLPLMNHELPRVNWDLYGWLCFRHRSAIVQALNEPLRPAAIKRHARRRDDSIRMSANNVRDVIKLFLRRGIVRPVKTPREPHPRYELTAMGQALRQLLVGAGVRA